MAQITVEQAFQTALQHHKAGELAQAENLYRQILAQQPNHADALHLLGLIAHQVGQNDVAVELIGHAIALKPDLPEAYSNLGNALKAIGRLDEAIATCRQAIALKPDLPEAHSVLGVALREKGNLDEAMTACRQAIALKPTWPEAHINLGNALKAKGQLDEAMAAYRQAIALKPGYPEAYSNLGVALQAKGQLEDAIAAYREAIALNPSYPDAHSNLGNALQSKGNLEEAIVAYRQAITLKPDWPEVFSNLGNTLHANGQLDEAIAAFRQAIALKPSYPEAHNNLGVALKDNGQLDEAINAFYRAIDLKPSLAVAHSNLVNTLHFHPAYDAQAILAEHWEWAQRHADPLSVAAASHDNDRSPGRRLRIGYVSPDFRQHIIGRCIEPVLAHHDRAGFEVFCYSNVRREDAVTERLRDYGHAWRSIATFDDAQAAAMIRADHIDILVDLAVHSANNRLLVFARKPAPVQATHLGCPATTGMVAVDYRITDPYLDPPGTSEADNTEKLVRLPHCFWCYLAPGQEPVGELPSLTKAYVTFGSLNNPPKVTAPTIQLWCDVLKRAPDSRLMLLVPGPGSTEQSLRRQFESQGVDSSRLELVPRCPLSEYLKLYTRIDIGLDTIPCNGHTTSIDSFWMGVPVVALRGRTSMGRAGVSLLSNLGLEHLIAETPRQYVDIVAALAADLPQLSKLRRTLRQRLDRSPIMDPAAYTRDLEALYRQMWRAWCAKL